MNDFIDPRTNPSGSGNTGSLRTTTETNELGDLHRLCREGRLYDVERWIRQARPLQLTKEAAADLRGRFTSALQIAIGEGNHGLVLLLLCNGYDPNLEPSSPLDAALDSRRLDLVDLLLEYGSDPHLVDLHALFGTYRTDLFEQFWKLGVDLTDGHELAAVLGYHTSNKPLFGFARRHRKDVPKIQQELDMALAHHAAGGNKKGVSLCLWAGADPHAPAHSLRYGREEEDEDDAAHRFMGFSAINEASRRGDVEILERLRPDPSLDDFDELYRVAGSGGVVEYLARLAPPRKMGPLLQAHLSWFPTRSSEWRTLDVNRTHLRGGSALGTRIKGGDCCGSRHTSLQDIRSSLR